MNDVYVDVLYDDPCNEFVSSEYSIVDLKLFVSSTRLIVLSYVPK